MNLTLADTKSPIRALYRHLAPAVRRIAPEKLDEIEKRSGHLDLAVVERSDWVFDAMPGLGIVRISRAALEFFWCLAYGYVVIYQKMVEEQHFRGELDLHAHPATAAAADLLQWAFERWAGEAEGDWPQDLPQPVENPALGSMENVADELCLSAIAVFLHHEIAHCQAENIAEGDPLKREEMADQEAAAILLRGIDVKTSFFTKRALAVAVGFAALVGYGIIRRDHAGREHPPHFKRLLSALEPYLGQHQDHVAWAMAITIIKLHFDQAGISTPPRVYADFRACAYAYAEVIENQMLSQA